MLPSANDFKNSILALSPTNSQASGSNAFAGVIATFTNLVQAGSNGTAGILTFGTSAMVTVLSAMPKVADDSWKASFANAWEAGITASIITPGTVTDPTWIGSGNLDTNTLPTAAATIPNISAAKTTLLNGLANVGPTSDAPLPLAEAIRNATLQLQFTCIGLGPPPSFTPIPLTFTAQ